MNASPDNFQLLFRIEGLNPGELLWIGYGLMGPLMTTADVFVDAGIIPADAWSIACADCHPKDTECWLKETGQTIVKDERKVAILIASLNRPRPSAPADPTDILDA